MRLDHPRADRSQASAVSIRSSVAFSAALTFSPPKPRKPPSLPASATLAGDRAQPVAEARRRVRAPWPPPAPRPRPARPPPPRPPPPAPCRGPAPSARRAPCRGPRRSRRRRRSRRAAGRRSPLAARTAPATATLSLTAPQIPPGSAAVTAIPASIGAPTTRAHSSAVKASLTAMESLPCFPVRVLRPRAEPCAPPAGLATGFRARGVPGPTFRGGPAARRGARPARPAPRRRRPACAPPGSRRRRTRPRAARARSR